MTKVIVMFVNNTYIIETHSRRWRTRLLSDSLLAVSLNHISGENLVQADVFHRSDLRLEVEGASVSKKNVKSGHCTSHAVSWSQKVTH